MIKAIIDGINPDKYIYDTGLDFGVDVGHELLEKAINNVEVFERRYNFYYPESPAQLTRKIGAANAREAYRRIGQMKAAYTGGSIKLQQYAFPDDLAQQFLNTVPQWILDLSPREPTPALQISCGGDYIGVHKGHKRQVSLFMLLQGQGQETRWYRETEDFALIDMLRIPDYDKIEHVVTAVMQPWRWYIFNNFEWHSVHNYSDGLRINVGFDFNNISTSDLLKAVQEQAVTA